MVNLPEKSAVQKPCLLCIMMTSMCQCNCHGVLLGNLLCKYCLFVSFFNFLARLHKVLHYVFIYSGTKSNSSIHHRPCNKLAAKNLTQMRKADECMLLFRTNMRLSEKNESSLAASFGAAAAAHTHCLHLCAMSLH